MQLRIEIPEDVSALLASLRDAGDRPFLVGGIVRDALLGETTRDFDIATSLTPDRLGEILDGVALEYGAVSLSLGAAEVTVTTLRRDGPYLDRRHPSSVAFVTTPAEDAVRRDFTINALYADPFTGELVDPCGGLADLRSKTIRMIGDPTARFAEDPLRLLRAIRFAARLDFAMDEATEGALRSCAGDTSALSRERVFDELTRVFTGPGRGRGLRLLVELGVAAHVLPEVTAMPGVPQPKIYHPEGDVFVHTCLVLDHARESDPVQAWAAVLHDVGKPATISHPGEQAADRIRFDGHDQLSASMADEILRRFQAPRELRETVVEICRDHIRFAAIPRMKRHKRERWMRSPTFAAHLEFHRADCMGCHGRLEIYESARTQWQSLPPEPPPPLCTGADAIALGVPEGPGVGAVLRELESRLDDESVSDRDAALALLRQIVESRFRQPE